MIHSSHSRNKSISSEAVGTHFIYFSDQRLDQTVHMSTGQRFDASLLNWSPHGMNHTRVQSSLSWEAAQWLKVGNVFTSPSYFRVLVILHGNHSMLKHAHKTLSLMADLHVSALTRKGENDACILLFVCNSKPLFSPFCFRKL